MPNHRIQTVSIHDDASCTMGCECGDIFVGKDRAAAMQEWKRHVESERVGK